MKFNYWVVVLLLLVTNFTASANNIVFSRDQQTKLMNEFRRYEAIASQGGWPKITLDRKYYMRGHSSNVIAQVKKRLKLTGDYAAEDMSPLFTDELAAAVLNVRERFGLPLVGNIDAPLIEALNVPVEKRLAQIRANAKRVSEIQVAKQGIHLVANIPDFKLHVYENGEEVFDMDIVVGKESTRTVMFSAVMNQVVFSPYWNVPASIVRNELLPAARRDKNYLRNNGYEIVGNAGGLPSIRQKPGAGNSLGKVKFLFPNPHSIYFHDTPAKSLFKMDQRAYSHGCIRLAEPAKLAQYLLKNDPQWKAENIAKAMNSGREQVVRLKKGVPVSIVYFTAWVDETGKLNFRDDIYGRDKA